MTAYTCSNCRHINRQDNNYCTKCGHKLHKETIVGPCLLVLTNDKSSIVFQIGAGKSTIGRHMKNTIVINDDQVSNHHAEITSQNGNFWIADLESKNGVYLNGRKIEQSCEVNDGSLIKLGSTILRFEAEHKTVLNS